MEGNVDIPITPPTLLPIDPDIEYDESDNGIPVLSSNVSIEHSIADDESNGLTMLNDSFSGSSSSSFGPSGDTSVAEYILAANTWIFMLVCVLLAVFGYFLYLILKWRDYHAMAT
ncbi:hypothetical protein PABG_00835 [Paracoccidioides brasiliensis Pb03]|uniref:Uncharacterized protein n=1 Tax=Paracoccidioides brasiliensis (strain Pb18) TaxID=502780 RepID=C1G7Y6_PARBD|nr:uncharacterized protein PADG_03291 [Paracoccidioides brasiliensis Pb18]EEH18272.1 hypothetical protein PABG_00835 [Paracoccidioides brasiliensis Pb03]EEH47193.1 hypothetical protein PADG_03291 [Paracoccidioides brasiliensis Pb18]ODH48646.1 hypothetical protein GX48_05185 [Paracoccidioides brasiliensis]